MNNEPMNNEQSGVRESSSSKRTDLLTANPEIVAALRDRYRAILVDEYQDTDAVQERLLELLAGDGAGLTVVGDDDQSIYRFRGATVNNLLSFQKHYPGTRTILLTENFRSREPVVTHSLDVIVHNPARFAKDLFTRRGPGSDVLLVYERSVGEEATALADLLRRLHSAGKIRRWNDVVLLLRSVRSYAAAYADALRAAGIPVVVAGDATLFERDDVQQLVNLFTFLGATQLTNYELRITNYELRITNSVSWACSAGSSLPSTNTPGRAPSTHSWTISTCCAREGWTRLSSSPRTPCG